MYGPYILLGHGRNHRRYESLPRQSSFFEPKIVAPMNQCYAYKAFQATLDEPDQTQKNRIETSRISKNIQSTHPANAPSVADD